MYDKFETRYSANASTPISMTSLMQKVYTWMAFALAITGLTAFGVATSPALIGTILSNQILFFGLIVAEFITVIALTAAINKMSSTTATLMFILYSVLNGATLSVIFLAYTMSSIASVFFITAGTFGAMALFGSTTKTDLSSMGKFLFMALIGLIIATLVNVFIHSTALDMVLNYVGVLIFTGLTAYDVQKIKALLYQSEDNEAGQKLAVLGALTLYLDFINLFIYLLKILGKRR